MVRNWKQKERDIKTSASVLKTIKTKTLKDAHEFITQFLHYRKSEKLESTYIKGTREALDYNGDGKVYCQFNFDGTVTGRLSCAAYKAGKGKKKGISFHLLPRPDEDFSDVEIRPIFCGPKGWAFITADYSGQELRVMGHVSKDEKMTYAFANDLDLHSYSASLALGCSIGSVTKSQRQDAKEVSFLTIFGGTEYTLASKRRISISKARIVIQSWFDSFPDVPAYMRFIEKFIQKNAYVYSIFGRRRHLPDARSQEKRVRSRCFRQGLNFTVQSPASDIILCAILGMCRTFEERKLKAQFIATVHDSVELACPLEELEQVLEILRYNMIVNPVMRKTFDLDFRIPFEIETIVGHTFGDGVEVEYDGDLPQNMEEIRSYLNV